MSEPKRKLTFQRDEGLGKLKLRFEDGELSLELSKHRSAHTLTREQAQELALWLSAWSLKLIDNATKAEAAAEEGRVEPTGGQDAARTKKGQKAKRKGEKKQKERNAKPKDEKGEKKKDVRATGGGQHGGGEDPAGDARKRDRDTAS